jgi:hypothetical protein
MHATKNGRQFDGSIKSHGGEYQSAICNREFVKAFGLIR